MEKTIEKKFKKEKTEKSLLKNSIVGGIAGGIAGVIDGIFDSNFFNHPLVYSTIISLEIADNIFNKEKTALARVLDAPTLASSYFVGYNVTKSLTQNYKHNL